MGYKITDEGLLPLVNLPIKELTLGQLGKITHKVGFIISKLTQLESLTLSCIHTLNDNTLEYISQLPSLRRVSLIYSKDNITDNGIAFLKNMSTLLELKH